MFLVIVLGSKDFVIDPVVTILIVVCVLIVGRMPRARLGRSNQRFHPYRRPASAARPLRRVSKKKVDDNQTKLILRNAALLRRLDPEVKRFSFATVATPGGTTRNTNFAILNGLERGSQISQREGDSIYVRRIYITVTVVATSNAEGTGPYQCTIWQSIGQEFDDPSNGLRVGSYYEINNDGRVLAKQSGGGGDFPSIFAQKATDVRYFQSKTLRNWKGFLNQVTRHNENISPRGRVLMDGNLYLPRKKITYANGSPSTSNFPLYITLIGQNSLTLEITGTVYYTDS